MGYTKRDAVWDGMVGSDRLARYYGSLAARLSAWDQYISWGVTGAAAICVAGSLMDKQWAVWAAGAAALLSMGPLVRPRTRQIVRSFYCAQRLAENHIKWKELWREMEASGDVSDARIGDLSKEMTETTAPNVQDRVHSAIADRTERQCYAFWRKADSQQTVSSQAVIATNPQAATAR